jgi:hypothetical protein
LKAPRAMVFLPKAGTPSVLTRGPINMMSGGYSPMETGWLA